MSLLLVGVWWDRGEEPSTTVTALPHDPAEIASADVPGGSGTGTAAPPGSGTGAADALRGSGSGAVRGGSGTGMAALPHGSAAPVAAPGGSGRGTATTAVPGGSGRVPGAHSRPPTSPRPGKRTSPAPARSTPVAHTPGSRPRALASPTRRPGTHGIDDRAPRRPHAPAAAPHRPRAATATRARPPAPAPRKPRTLPPSRATRVLIPYLRVDAPVMDLGLDREHRLTAPPEDDPKLVGWYKQGASPGEQGTAVAVGHLDTDSGPAVFAGLTELKRGRIVKVRRADGRIAVYTVDRIKSYEKAHFPSQEVYGARGRPELRLITCGGSYDRRKGYSGNVVVFAHLTGVR
ncbi:class F sortase [Streptomyces olindensis]|uniref:class F sortase n=1 Tax=Streptomyces olindensis TaxID=358823 RepID=UPI0036C6DE9D